MTRTHPGNLRLGLANRCRRPGSRATHVRRSGRSTEPLRAADLVVFEGTAALLLVERIRGLAPGARLVYRASDDLRALGVHPLILEAEARGDPALRPRQRAATENIADVLAPYGPVEMHPPASTRRRSIEPTESPYASGPAAVFAGVSPLFDYGSLATAGELAPHVSFHVIGPPPRPLPANVSFHPELAYRGARPVSPARDLRAALLPAGRREPPLGKATRSRSTPTAGCRSSRRPISGPSGRTCACSSAGTGRACCAPLLEAERMPHSPAFAEGVQVCRGARGDPRRGR